MDNKIFPRDMKMAVMGQIQFREGYIIVLMVVHWIIV